MIIGNRKFDVVNNIYIMGILNVTPDSFSDGGKYNQCDAALRHCEKMINDGADIIDIGGESTRPGHTQISDEEEIERTTHVIEKIKSNFNTVISLDTYKSKVAQAGIKAGADLINDIWGLQYDDNMAKVIADKKVACCLMHNRKEAIYHDFLSEVQTDLAESIYLAKKAGIHDEKIMIDPGIGFAKTYEQNLEMMNHLESLKYLGYPVLLGTSRKSMIGLTLNNSVDERLAGTIATTVIGVIKGCSFIRVHDVKENADAIKMTKAILRG